MLTLDEAITRFKALSKANRSRAESYNRGEDYELMKAKECETCADECEQVASWITELLERREADRWIPVSERLPENAFTGCLVTVYETDKRTGDEYEIVLPYSVGYDGETWNDIDGEIIPFEVIAWRPLPEAYKESEDK